jgi:hypothetical protein
MTRSKWCIRQVYVQNCGVKTPRFRKVFALREVDPAERADVEKLAHSRKAEARLVERAAVVWRCLQGQPAGVASRLTVRMKEWLLGRLSQG